MRQVREFGEQRDRGQKEPKIHKATTPVTQTRPNQRMTPHFATPLSRKDRVVWWSRLWVLELGCPSSVLHPTY